MKYLILLFAIAISCTGGNTSSADQVSDAEWKQFYRNPRVVCSWNGYQDNNVCYFVNVDTVISNDLALRYSKVVFHQKKKYQNVYLLYYDGSAPDSIPVPQGEKIVPGSKKLTGLMAINSFIKKYKYQPFVFVRIFADLDYSVGEIYAE